MESEGLSPDHDMNILFTRMLAGSTDYHLGGFRAVTADKYQNTIHKTVNGWHTLPHAWRCMLCLENYLQMVCDYPAAYEGEPGFEFIKQIPTTWDETKVLNAEVSNYITIARRKNNDWYVGTINNHEARQLTIPLSFLDEGNYTATIYTDADDVTTDPNHLKKETKQVTTKMCLY